MPEPREMNVTLHYYKKITFVLFFLIHTPTGDKEYLYLDEKLTRLILELDKVQTDGLENVKSARRSAIQRIQTLLNTLESKV